MLRLLAQGKSNREIADQVVVTELTVRTHVSNILGKLHLTSRTQTALYAHKEGLASLGDSPRMKTWEREDLAPTTNKGDAHVCYP